MGVVSGTLVDVIEGRLRPIRLEYSGEMVTSMSDHDVKGGGFILPGLIDSHLHIESSRLCPSRFAEVAVPHGTTCVIADPHEVANVMGMEGIEYMVRDGSTVPLRFRFSAPSCVPATQWETSGATLGHEAVASLLARDDFVSLGEMMDVPGVLNDNTEVLDKIAAAVRLGKPVDGHCPELRGDRLQRYIDAGISTDHESISLEEAQEKHRRGMRVMVREGSAARNMMELMPLAREHRCFLVTDDMEADDLVRGHLDLRLAMAVSQGMDPVRAVCAVTLWPAMHYGLPIGRLQPGLPADRVVVDDLESFRVREVIIGGKVVARNGMPLFGARPLPLRTAILRQRREPEEFLLRHEGAVARVRVIEVDGRQIESGAGEADLPVVEGNIMPIPGIDVSIMAVANRYRDAPLALGFVRGFGLRRGAMATTVAHDSHNIVAVGVEPRSLAQAVNLVSEDGGYVVVDGDNVSRLALDVAGLMSTKSCDQVVEADAKVLQALRGMGCGLPSPFMTLSFQCLLVVPELKMSDKGMFDSRAMDFVDPVLE